MTATTMEISERNSKIIEILSNKEKEGFKYGEVTKFIENLADDMDTNFKTVQNLYYYHVKGKFNNTEPDDIDQRDNLIRTDNINGKEVRLVHDDELTEYYVAKDVFECLNIDRTSPLAKEGIKKEYKYYIPVKSSHGYVKTTVLKPDNLEEFLKFVIQKHTSAVIREKAQNFLNFLQGTEEILPSPVQPTMTETIAEPETKPTSLTNTYQTKQQVENPVEQSTKQQEVAVKEVKKIEQQAKKEEETKEPQVIVQKQEQLQASVQPAVSPYNTTLVVEEQNKQEVGKIPSYKYGEILEVQVNHIAPYGVIVETLDDFNIQGLIHVGDVKYGYVSDLTMYFALGDKVKALVKRYDKENNRLNLSTKELKIPLRMKENTTTEDTPVILEEKPVNDSLAQELLKVKDKLNLTAVVQNQEPIKENSIETISSVTGTNKIINTGDKKMMANDLLVEVVERNPIAELEIEGNKEIQSIVSRLNNKIGAISPQARERLLQLLNEKGIVEFTIAMMEVLPEFKADLGMIVLGEIEKKMGGYL